MAPDTPRGDLTAGQRAALIELDSTHDDRWLDKRTLSSLRAGVELRGEKLLAGETLPLAEAGLLLAERPLAGVTLYSITDAGRRFVERAAGQDGATP
jgi:hypothetical protein